MTKNLLIDFDSTVISSEIMEVLASVALKNNKNKEKILQKIKSITDLGMAGKIPFNESLARRIKLLPINKEMINKTILILTDQISPSFEKNLNYLKKYNLQILSGAFNDIILPLMSKYGLDAKYIYAVDFIFNGDKFVGIDSNCLLAQEMGKVKIVKELNLVGETIVVGDGYTDWQIKEAGLAKFFFYYNENVSRPEVMKLADEIIEDFDDLIIKLNNY